MPQSETKTKTNTRALVGVGFAAVAMLAAAGFMLNSAWQKQKAINQGQITPVTQEEQQVGEINPDTLLGADTEVDYSYNLTSGLNTDTNNMIYDSTIDSNSKVHFTFISNDNKPMYGTWNPNGGKMIQETIDYSSDNIGVQIALDNDDNPYILMIDFNENKFIFLKPYNDTWIQNGFANFGAYEYENVFDYIIDKDNAGHIVIPTHNEFSSPTNEYVKFYSTTGIFKLYILPSHLAGHQNNRISPKLHNLAIDNYLDVTTDTPETKALISNLNMQVGSQNSISLGYSLNIGDTAYTGFGYYEHLPRLYFQITGQTQSPKSTLSKTIINNKNFPFWLINPTTDTYETKILSKQHRYDDFYVSQQPTIATSICNDCNPGDFMIKDNTIRVLTKTSGPDNQSIDKLYSDSSSPYFSENEDVSVKEYSFNDPVLKNYQNIYYNEETGPIVTFVDSSGSLKLYYSDTVHHSSTILKKLKPEQINKLKQKQIISSGKDLKIILAITE